MMRAATFRFKPFSQKQKKVLTWWRDASPVRDSDGIIADGSIRSGKTLSMSLSFVMWAMEKFDGQNFAMSGKTIGSFRRNVLNGLKPMLKARGFSVQDKRSDNLVEVSNGDIVNYFYIFGGKDERSQDLIQGITLAGALFDEVALMPESFVNQATGRCSVDGSKYWFNCNPGNPQHFFNKEWIQKYKEKNLLYLHFTMDDNLSLSEKIKARYKAMYSGVFFKRYVLGLWVAADGLCYQTFADNPERYIKDDVPRDDDGKIIDGRFISIGLDWGGNRSLTAFVATMVHGNFEKIGFIKDHHITGVKGSIDGNRVNTEFIRFVKELQEEYKVPIRYCFADSAEQYLNAGLAKAVKSAGLSVSIGDSHKAEIVQRIVCLNTLFNTDRVYILRRCGITIDGLRSTAWDAKAAEKGLDKRLDDFSTDVDIVDACEYSFSRFMSKLTPKL